MAPKTPGGNETPETKLQTPPADQDNQAALAAKDAEISALKLQIDGLENDKADLVQQNAMILETVNTTSVELENCKENVKDLNRLLENKDGIIFSLEQRLGAGTKSSDADLGEVSKDEIVAFKNGIERNFPRLAWESLPADKGGWRIKVETPKEAQ
ncbi:hypothetical protein [Sphingobacterium multivorum]|uniref:hypothetical protein n=1 Tax=Sphingobacterium multivorum TaxID=28454 RepID=UPI0028AA5738|nr:hypothetical protein [Sphingobacterium multivorum]